MRYEDNLAETWREKFFALAEDERAAAEKIIARNKFSDKEIGSAPEKIRELLEFYRIRR